MLGYILEHLNLKAEKLLPKLVVDACLDHLFVVYREKLVNLNLRVVVVYPIALLLDPCAYCVWYFAASTSKSMSGLSDMRRSCVLSLKVVMYRASSLGSM